MGFHRYETPKEIFLNDSMYFRKSRVRFIGIRCCLFLFILLFIYKFKRSFEIDDHSIEYLFWKQIRQQDRYLTDQQRIDRIQSVQKSSNRYDHNWTRVFYEIYANKLAKQTKNLYKQIFFDKQQNFSSQQTFQIFEETPVSHQDLQIEKKKHTYTYFLGLSTSKILFINTNISSSMSIY